MPKDFPRKIKPRINEPMLSIRVIFAAENGNTHESKSEIPVTPPKL